MFLFFNDMEEDFGFMIDGYKNGIITDERLNDALRRILGLKAHLKLHEKKKNHIFAGPKEELSNVGCEKHLKMGREAIKKSITLVKDTQKNLPISPDTHKRVYAYVIGNNPISRDNKPDKVRAIVQEELERIGYQVDMHQNYYDKVDDGIFTFEKKMSSMYIGKIEEFKKKYDAVFVFFNISGYAQTNTVRISWSMPHSLEIPWYVKELPTVFVSLNFTNHLIDIPMAKTFINAYVPNRETIRQTIEKIAGRDEFYGICNENVFCGRQDTRW